MTALRLIQPEITWAIRFYHVSGINAAISTALKIWKTGPVLSSIYYAGLKKESDNDFPVQILMNALEIGGGEEGLNIEETKEIAKIFQEAGADSLHIRTHWLGVHQGSFCQEVLFYPEPHIPLKEFPKEMDWSRRGPGANVPLAAMIKEIVSVPVMAVGGLDADLGEKVLREGKADLIGMNRRFFADPEYPNKVAEGRLDDIAPCTHCNNCNKGTMNRGTAGSTLLSERNNMKSQKPEKKKKVLVVGGGPSGMQTARVAAMRGHDVTLFEKGHYLGGSLPLAAMVKGFEVEDLPAFIRYFKGQLKKLGVNVRLSREFTPSDIDKIKPDVVVLALGGTPTLPEVPGINGRNVTKSADLYGTLTIFYKISRAKALKILNQNLDACREKCRYNRRRDTGLPARRISDQTGQKGYNSGY